MLRSRIEFIIKKRGVCLKNECTLYGRHCRGLLLDLVSEGLKYYKPNDKRPKRQPNINKTNLPKMSLNLGSNSI